MSIKYLEVAGDMEGLEPATKLVLMALCDDAAKDTRIAYPGIEKLIRWSGRSKRRVSEIIEELIRDGHLARRTFAYPGRRAEYYVFPTDAELAELDELDPRLNESRKRPPRKRKSAQPVDNSTGMGAARRAHSEPNGRGIEPNGRGNSRTPPVSTPLNSSDGLVPDVTTEGDVDNSGTGPGITPATFSATHGKPLHTKDVFTAVGEWLPTSFSDDQLCVVASEILDRAPTAVLDPTGYVIRAIRNSVHPNERRRGHWLQRCFEIADDHLAAGLREGARF